MEKRRNGSNTSSSGTSNSKKISKTKSSSKKKSSTKSKGKSIKYDEKIMINERKKKKRTSKIIFIFFFIGVLIAVGYLLCTLEAFNLKNINLNETEKYSKEEIVSKAGIEIGKNTFLEFFTSDKKNVSTMPYVESIKLSVKFPNEINIEVIERTGKYYAYDKDKNIFYMLSEDGYILENADINNKKEDEILLVGITFDNEVMLGKKINDIDLTKLKIIKKIEKEFIYETRNGKITKISFENSLTTITINDKLSVIFPNDTDLEYKMVFLKTILESIPEDSVGIIDMTKTKPTYSSF